MSDQSFLSDNNNQKDTNVPDLEIWVKIRNGDSTAFSIIFKRYYQILYQFCGRFVEDAQTAENIVQEVFVTLWTEREKLQITSSLKSYLYISVRNRALNYVNKLKIRTSSEPDILDKQDKVETPENGYINNEIHLAVHKAIKKLPEKCRQIYLMKRYDNLKYTEIAEILNISVNTVKTQLQRAIELLQKHLAYLLNSLLC